MNTNKQILIVDDDDDFREILCNRIKLHEEFVPIEAANGIDAMAQTKSSEFDLIILDVGLPDIDGREVCKLMRKNGVTVPIIMLTGASADADTILGLDSGADDYIAKPFRMEVLIARIRAHIR
jgi:DNA-binding response OmpR family regulator